MEITDPCAKGYDHVPRRQGVLTSDILHFVLYAWGGFLVVMSVVFLRRALQPSCRNCICWQECLHEQLVFAVSRGRVTPRVPCRDTNGFADNAANCSGPLQNAVATRKLVITEPH